MTKTSSTAFILGDPDVTDDDLIRCGGCGELDPWDQHQQCPCCGVCEPCRACCTATVDVEDPETGWMGTVVHCLTHDKGVQG